MKATYKQHQGFEHLSSIISAHPPYHNMRQSADDTSTKKYPNNKYFQFDDEDSSGRKYLKEKLNLETNDRNEQTQPQHCPELGCKESSSLPKKSRSSKEEIHHSLIGGESELQYHKPKDPSKGGCRTAQGRLTNKSASYSKYKNKKSSAFISTVESRCQTKNNVIQSSRNHVQSTDNELKYYKKLCFDMRKRNTELAKELTQCRQQNRRSLNELQRKVEKISEKYMCRKENKENQDNHRNEKIIESIKTIKGKLNKKQAIEGREEKRFYEFFMESLGILQPDHWLANRKLSAIEMQTLWKQILQFLITHQFKIDHNCNIKTIR